MRLSRGTRCGFFVLLSCFFCFSPQAQTGNQETTLAPTPAQKAAVEGFIAGSYRSPSGEATAYRLFVPPDYNAAKKYPIVLWLHGAAGRGSDNFSQISG